MAEEGWLGLGREQKGSEGRWEKEAEQQLPLDLSQSVVWSCVVYQMRTEEGEAGEVGGGT